jgi:molybdopterin converting factor small subunit
MIVRIPSPLRSYTAGKAQVESAGAAVADVLADLDKQHPGIRFRMIDEQDRIRQHIKIFVNTNEVQNLEQAVGEQDTVHIICALSGG